MSSRSITSTALEMHQKVSPDRWCVTRLDLKYLHVQVLEAVQAGQIFSRSCSGDTAGTQESEDDDEFGPSIYTVTEQYIKPVTAEAGKMSWALMRNPFGLDCDLFVSHAWQEGIFEFLSKVRTSWPRGARNAWCCMLANPQNLNVSSMLLSPRASPFALALQASSVVLVVPNRHRSVYTRLWCGYEAYVASEEDKTIQVAMAPGRRSMCFACLKAMVPVVLGLVLGTLDRFFHWQLRVFEISFLVSMCAFTSAIARPSLLRRVVNYVGLLSSGALEVCWDQKRLLVFQEGPTVLEHIAQRVVWLCGIAFFLVAELDRARSLRLDEEGHQLRKGFEGSIRFASCSQETDMRNIWEEIGNKVDDVDHAIDVLISAGISSPDLRFAAEQGVDIEEAGHADYAMAVVVLGPLQLISLKNAIQVLLFSPELWQEATFAWLGLLASLSCSIMILGGSVDQRAFILKVMNKLCTLTFIPFAAVMGAVGNEEGDVALQVLQVLFTSLHNIKIVVLFFSVLSIRGTLKLPGFSFQGAGAAMIAALDRTKRARGVAVWARHSLRHHVMALPDARTITGDAIAMHEFVSPDRWCVTRLDLQSLRLEVLKAVQSGSIFSRSYSQDTTISQESEDDDEFGPSIYTVTEQYIKPVTAEAGKMSWALMRNPFGLDCDLFVSHAWQEGIFEFLSKVLTSWPSGAHHAWCCMLANPQNLNVGSMLLSPRMSPFALALQASSHVLVVPNRHRSVYTRLWCCFEAYVASEEDKTIEIATAPSGFAQRRALLQALVPLTMGLVIGAIGRLTHLTLRVETAVAVFSSICAFVSAYSLRWRRVANYFGLLAAGNLEVRWDPKHLQEFQLLPPVIEEICQRLVWLSAIAFFLVAELDRVRSWHLAEEGQQLRKDFKGSIRFASCTRPGDMMNIWDEIGHKVDAVDNAIDVLISAGISSPALRSAAVKGVDITGAGHADGAISFVVLGPLQLISVKNAIQMHLSFAPTPQAFWWQAIFALIGVMASLICTVLIGVRPVDERAFLMKVMTKLCTVIFIPIAVGLGIAESYGGHAALSALQELFVCFHILMIVALFFAVSGIRGTLALPGGKCILQYFLVRRSRERLRASSSLSESDTE
ncbi:Uncharacterized protein SCF082_LOCUS1718 [Durusdinium trenchii]|uniref:H(+)-exporting diphosphatase n=1 Tax=Durusdinium trenchii TaxID=1381693 RepID=A0ABP0HH87_9DINO